MNPVPITQIAGVKIPDRLPKWCPQYLAYIAEAYEDGRKSFHALWEDIYELSETGPGLDVYDPSPAALAGLNDAFFDVGEKILRRITPIWQREKIAAAIAPHIVAGKARGHIIIAAYRAANGGVDSDLVEHIVAEEIAAAVARERAITP